ncbi:SRPBCC family protein [Nocardia cyriacigeorgica]|uniref:SRPBCC family protein n=1 Tax=Nocardia cyriacigeorgica TaxID=135487 RepID=UPI0013D13E40|nr:SRPBCC family protein [Nocardia cyriacigeorgica]MBF6456961.1 SRPBCC family protein [Nocardia cyriacigeorgica]MBF6476972.1 SRPBCC family protein [Nocardia cyriacigeorgica]MBF6554378.1 SRPBCC family protein [Nocardia cyriacigeorgica]NEW26822.1 SRPBCC family protein [Nocardia cyriacigeorgica]
MASTTVDTVIAAPRETVYRLFADRESISPYLPVQLKLVKPGTTEREGVGAQHHVGLGPVGVTEEITALVPGERMEYKIVKGAPVKRHVGIVTFADAPGGTRVTYTMESEPSLPVPAKVLEAGLKVLISQFINGAKKAVR